MNDFFLHREGAAHKAAADDASNPGFGKNPIDKEKALPASRAAEPGRFNPGRLGGDEGFEVFDSFSMEGGNPDHACDSLCTEDCGSPSKGVLLHFLASLPGYLVDFRNSNNQPGYTGCAEHPGVVFALFHPSVVGGYHQERQVQRPGAGHHITDVAFMTGYVDDADIEGAPFGKAVPPRWVLVCGGPENKSPGPCMWGRFLSRAFGRRSPGSEEAKGGETEIGCHSPCFFFGQSVRIDSRQGPY